MAETLVNDGETYTVPYDSNNVPQDFTIPSSSPPGFIIFEVRGAEGGRAYTNDCQSNGGSGVATRATFEVGTGSSQLEPGGQIRFIVGKRGGDDNSGYQTAGGGGGGSGVLYKAPGANSEWILLMAAGGGGGAFQGQPVFCRNGHNGSDALTGEDGGDGGDSTNGGDPGCRGGSISPNGSGGGGGSGNCGGVGYIITDLSGLDGYPAGGDGGAGVNGASGGWGYGGGGGSRGTDTEPGGAGGGGGYSGGGGGQGYQHGGGGGSFVKSWATYEQITVSPASDDGIGSYQTLSALGSDNCSSATWITTGSITSSTEGYPQGITGLACPEQPYGAYFKFENPETYVIDVTFSTQAQTNPFVQTSLTVVTQCGLGAQLITCAPALLDTPPLNHTATWTMQPDEVVYIRVGAFSPIPLPGGTSYDLDVNYSVIDVQSLVSIAPSGSGSGLVTSSPAGIDCGSDCSETYSYPEQVTLTATPDSGSVFAGFSGNADCTDGIVEVNTSGDDVNCTATFDLVACPANSSGAPICACDSGYSGTPTWDAGSGSWTGSCEQLPDDIFSDSFERKFVFVTSQAFNGSLDIPDTLVNIPTGLERADNICNTLAMDAGLPGTYTAWLSDANTNAIDRVGAPGVPYYLTAPGGGTGPKVVDDFSDIAPCPADGTQCLLNVINVDENGAGVGGLGVWTGTSSLGTVAGDCNSWTVSSGSGAGSGETTWVDSRWTQRRSVACEAELRLYCFQD